MNKEELIRTVSQETDRIIPQDKILLVLNKTVEIISRTLTLGEAVKWSGFGSLVLKESPPRRIYSPSKKEFIVTKGTKSIVFKESEKRKKR